MKFTQKENKNLTLLLDIKLEEKDYDSRVQQKLNEYKKNTTLPGFRRGKVPLGLIVKKYRTSIVVDEVNKLLQDEVYKYIKDNKSRFLGSPIPKEDLDIDWENDTNFHFQYEIGMAPEFDVKITAKDKITYHIVEADKKLVDSYCQDIAKRYGKMSNPEYSLEDDLVFCLIEQLGMDGNIMGSGISNEATVSIASILDKKIKKQFINVKKGDIVRIDVTKGFTHRADLAAMLKIKQEEIDQLDSRKFQFTINNVNRLIPSKLDQELFDQVYGKNNVKDIKEFKAKIKQEAEQSFISESDRMLKNDIVDHLLKKIKLKLPDEFLKKWLAKTSEKPITEEKINQEYEMYAKGLRWQLIEKKIIDDFKIKIEEKDILARAKQLVAIQMKQYGQQQPEESHLEEIAKNILKNDKEKDKIYHQMMDEKTLSIYKDNFKINNNKISYDDFLKLASQK